MKNLKIEWYCLIFALEFSRRHLRYAWIALIIWGCSLYQWRQKRILRVGYAFLQAMDDVLDGDLVTDIHPLTAVDQAIQVLKTRRTTDQTRLQKLALAYADETMHQLDESCLDKTILLLQEMRQDNIRSANKQWWTKAELKHHFHQTFELSLGLSFAAQHAEIRVEDVSELVDILSWCSTVRDFKEDWQHGLFNLPAEIINKVNDIDAMDFEMLIQEKEVCDWLLAERIKTIKKIATLEKKLPVMKQKSGYFIVKTFVKSAQEIAQKRFFKLYPHLRAI